MKIILLILLFICTILINLNCYSHNKSDSINDNKNTNHSDLHNKNNINETVGIFTLNKYNWDYKSYLNKWKLKFKELIKPPKEYYYVAGFKGKVKVKFEIYKSGFLKSIEVIESEGNNQFKEVTVNAIKETFPFFPLPAEYSDSTLVVKLNVDFPELNKLLIK